MPLRREITSEGNGPILIVGSMPTWDDIKAKRPFSSYAGKILRNALSRLKINARLDYVAQCQKAKVVEWHGDIANRIGEYKPSVIVPLGEAAAQAVLNRYNLDINAVHGYLFHTDNGTPVIPSLDPSDYFQRADIGCWLDLALEKAAKLVAGGKQDSPIKCQIKPTLEQVIKYCDYAAKFAEVSVDIECVVGTCELTAIAIAISPTDVMSIPFAGFNLCNYWSEDEEKEVWLAVQRVLASPHQKIFQNFIFDCMILDHFGLTVNGKSTIHLSSLTS